MNATMNTKERRAVAALRKLADNWPQSLQLFSWSGSLHVLKPGPQLTINQALVATVMGIPNDGGDPNGSDKPWEPRR